MRCSIRHLLFAATVCSFGCQNASEPKSGGSETTPKADDEKPKIPDELIGTWTTGSFDFDLWEKYKPGYWAGRNAIPMREAMIIKKNGEAKYYRYEFLFNFYENLFDCEGTVTFNEDKTFTFIPKKGRKRHIEARNTEKNVDRALTDEELKDTKWAGKRAYEVVPKSDPPTVKIKVPTSAAYNWYKAP